jgi:hypothetical protein
LAGKGDLRRFSIPFEGFWFIPKMPVCPRKAWKVRVEKLSGTEIALKGLAVLMWDCQKTN